MAGGLIGTVSSNWLGEGGDRAENITSSSLSSSCVWATSRLLAAGASFFSRLVVSTGPLGGGVKEGHSASFGLPSSRYRRRDIGVCGVGGVRGEVGALVIPCPGVDRVDGKPAHLRRLCCTTAHSFGLYASVSFPESVIVVSWGSNSAYFFCCNVKQVGRCCHQFSHLTLDPLALRSGMSGARAKYGGQPGEVHGCLARAGRWLPGGSSPGGRYLGGLEPVHAWIHGWRHYWGSSPGISEPHHHGLMSSSSTVQIFRQFWCVFQAKLQERTPRARCVEEV